MKIAYQAKIFALNQKSTDLKQEQKNLVARLAEVHRQMKEDQFTAKKQLVQKLD
jgi:hypothetical protein